MNKLIICMILTLVAGFSYAQDEGEAPAASTAKNKKVKVSFDDELVKGETPVPQAEFIFEKANFNYKKLIRFRENFIPEAEMGREEMGRHE